MTSSAAVDVDAAAAAADEDDDNYVSTAINNSPFCGAANGIMPAEYDDDNADAQMAVLSLYGMDERDH